MLCASGCGENAVGSDSGDSGDRGDQGASTTAENKSASAKTDGKNSKADDGAKKLSVVCTIFPEYDWVREIVGDNANVELTYLLDNGVDLHSYQPTAADIAKISSCDLFVCVGGESDEWVEGALAEAANKDMRVVNLMEVMGDKAKVEELKEGMQGHDHDHEHEHAEIEESDIKDRELSDFAGSWQSLYPLLEAGELEEYVKDHAEEHGEPEDEVREELAKKWGCDLTAVSVDGSKIEFTFADGSNKSGEYKYTGFTPVLADDGDIHAVRYQYEAVSGDSPKYVVFNDHGHEPAKARHFHIYYGDGADIESALAGFTYNPFFIPAGLSGEEALDVLSGHDHGKSEEHEHEHEEGEAEYDEHVWLSLKNAEVLCAQIESDLASLDPAGADGYKANLDAYVSKLDSLDSDFKTLIESAGDTTLIFGDRFPFRYLVDDYGIDYYAAFVGCSAETEASFETIAFLAGKADELGSDTIYTIENSDGRIAQSIIGATKAKDMNIAVLNSVQSVSKEQIAAGTTYLSLMQQNYDTMKADLG
ncbi:MAG: zinc ABC transporter substrate-binding protein [Ruminococcus sp.]|nr:zinc ABC transporter substrate-binding protein [Ruminococcus sp.]